MGSSSNIIKNTAYLYVKMFISMFVALFTTRIFLNVLGASDYGLYSLIASVIAFFGFLQDSLVIATLRFLCFFKGQGEIEKQKAVFNVSTLLHVFIAFFVALSLLFASNFLFDGFLNIESSRLGVAKHVYFLMIVTFVFSVVSIPYDSLLNANENMRFYSIVGIVESLLRLVLSFLISCSPIDKLIFYAYGLALITILSLLVKRVYCHKSYAECSYSLKFIDKKIIKQMVSYGGWNFLTAFTFLLSSNASGLVLNRFFGTIVNAAQGVATHVNGTMMQFSSNLLKAVNPVLNKSVGEKNEGKMIQFAVSGTKLSFVIFLLMCVPFIVEAKYVLTLWLKNVPQWTVIFCCLQLVRSLINQLLALFVNCVYASGKIKKYCIIKSCFNVLSIVAMYLCFSFGGAPYLSYIVLFVFIEVFGGGTIMFFMSENFGYSLVSYIKKILVPCISVFVISICVGYLINSLMNESLLRLFFVVAVELIVIIGLSWLVIFDEKEKSKVISFYEKINGWLKK
ncbi:lipopolysaccharide biosynthesis protein [Fibrobacter sp. HC4]|uniref:lipopolysaccharide biosynthesis protein n=1 Tax=Fibrobacter sp. HC4 TaxID=3239812 RepID=UPI002018ACC4|nr:oligosaccharide flippase family protein [Fibrobacter succinogenes]MCL4102579.1 hypothetical protein [Fibrobacter succinogenes]MCQ2100817.1 oligosaccharide flippase family protein [Fibrobacter sp.]